MSHIWMGHVTHMNESCCEKEVAISHVWMSHVTHVKKLYHTQEGVMSHIWMSRVIRMNESCRRWRACKTEAYMCGKPEQVYCCSVFGNTLEYVATLVLRHIYWDTLWHTEIHCNRLQHTATHCNTLEYMDRLVILCWETERKRDRRSDGQTDT